MKKRFFSILLCFCMVLGLLPATALATEDPDFSNLTEGETVTIDDIEYIYKGDGGGGIEMTAVNNLIQLALQEACCWKAGDGYVLYNPTTGGVDWYSVEVTTSAEVTLHNAEITSDACALKLPDNSPSSTSYPVDVTVNVEGENRLTTSDANWEALFHKTGYTTFSGGGILTLTNTVENAYSNFRNSNGAVNIEDGTQVTLSGGESYIIGNLTVTDSAKLTIASGTVLSMGSPGSGIDPNTSTVTVEDGAVLENNGTLNMFQKNKDEPSITGEISGSGGIVFPDESNTVYCLVDGEFIAYGGDISESGLNISGKKQDGTPDSTYDAPTEVTRYKAGENGYALFTPAEDGANAKLELNNATIVTASGRALYLPPEPVVITVVGENILTANNSYNFAIDPNMQAVSITGEGSLTLTGNKGIASWDGTAPGVTVHIDGELKINTPQSYSIVTAGDINLSAASITTGIISAGGKSFAATATTGNLTIDNGVSSSLVVTAGNIIMEAPNGEIAVMGKGNTLLDTNGKVDLNAKGNVTLISSENGRVPIYFGTGGASITSGEGSITLTTDGYSGIEKKDGSEVDGVTLDAAKDITLNADSIAVLASDRNVSITAGGKLSSTSAYGFQVGTLTIKADEVSIAGTSQDGIQANSVSITNTDGTNNCKSVSITATSGSDSHAAIYSSNVTIKADDVLICGNNSAKAINAQNSAGTVTIGDAGMIIGAVSISGTNAINPNILMIESTGVDASTGLDLSTPPDVITYYKAEDGYALFTPANGQAKATLTLHNASISTAGAAALKLKAETVIKLEGENSLVNSKTDSGVSILVSSTSGERQPATIQGGSDDSLTVSAWQCTDMGALTIDGGSVTMNGECYGISTEGNVVLKNGAKVSASGGDDGGAVSLEDFSDTEKCSLTVSDGSTLTVKESDAFITGDLTISGSGSKVTINSGATAMVLGTITVENSGVLENNGIWEMKPGTTVDEIKALKLTGSGLVRVRINAIPPTWDTYTNNGVKVNEISGGLDLTTGGDSGDLTTDGYAWDDSTSTLTLGDVYVSGGLTVPDNATITTATNSVIGGSISPKGDASCELTFNGNGSLTVNGSIGNSQGGTMTVSGGADVMVNGSVYICTSGGANGMLNVTGEGTTLNVSSSSGYALLFETVNVLNGGNLTASAEGKYSVGVQALSGGVHVKGGSTLSTGCGYGVYIIGGELEVDSTSVLTTNGAVAPFCVVDKTFNPQWDDVIKLPGIPIETQIIHADNGTKGYYWSLVPAKGTLSVSNENNDIVTLTGAKDNKDGPLTFQKTAKKHSSDSSGGASVTRTLIFDTNGGSDISSVSKTSGAAVDLKDYKPIRDGYDFAGWYSDEALTKKITSVTLTASMTVYAKWTENKEQTDETKEIKNPFNDVANSDYYYDAVQWAVEKNITSGTTNGSFSPKMICTRAQIVTFLWKAMRSPEPTAANCPFTDISKDAYYYKAVLWAVENDITAGATATTFSPNATVTRGQTVTLLWRGASKPMATIANPYTDVVKGAYNYDAVLWAAEKGITQGATATTFSPDTPCTRGQIVTFLYRYMEK